MRAVAAAFFRTRLSQGCRPEVVVERSDPSLIAGVRARRIAVLSGQESSSSMR